MKKKSLFTKFSVPMTALLIGLLMVGGTLGYLSSVTPTRTNQFSIGAVKTELLEPEFKIEGTEISKNPYVTNVGDVDCIVRLKIEISPKEIEVPLADNPSYKKESDDKDAARGGMNAKMSDPEAERLWDLGYRFWLNYNTKASFLKSAWMYNEADGYWYYQDVLSPSKDTSELFSEVKWLMTETVGGTEKFKDIQDFDIYIKKESTYAFYIDADDTQYSAKENGRYDQDNALVIWKAMSEAGKIY